MSRAHGTAVRHDEQRQVLRRRSLRQRQVGGNLEAVRRLVADRLHARELLPRQLLEHLVLLGQRLGVAIEDVARAGLGVAGRDDHPLAIVIGAAGDRDLEVGQLALHLLVVRFERLVAEIGARAVADVDGSDQLVGLLGEDGAAEVHLVLRIRFDELLLLRVGIEEDEARQIGLAAVGLHVDARVVGVELQRVAGLEHAAAIDLLEAGVGDAEDLGVAVVGRARREPRLAGAVHHPAGDLVGVLACSSLRSPVEIFTS